MNTDHNPGIDPREAGCKKRNDIGMFKGGQQRQRALPTQITDQPRQAGRHSAGLQIDQIHLRRDVGQQGRIVGGDEYQVHIEPSGSDPSAQIDRHPLRSAIAYGWQEKGDLS